MVSTKAVAISLRDERPTEELQNVKSEEYY